MDRDLRVKLDELCVLPFLSFRRCFLMSVEEGGGGGGREEEGGEIPYGEKKT